MNYDTMVKAIAELLNHLEDTESSASIDWSSVQLPEGIDLEKFQEDVFAKQEELRANSN